MHFFIYSPVSDSLGCKVVNVRVASVSEGERDSAVDRSKIAVFNLYRQLDVLVRTVRRRRRQHDQVIVSNTLRLRPAQMPGDKATSHDTINDLHVMWVFFHP